MSKRTQNRQEARDRKREFWKGVLYALLGVVLFFQIMTYVSVAFGKNLVGFEPPAKIREAGWLLPMLIIMVAVLAAAIVLFFLALDFGGVQWLGLAALLPLALYSGTRGKANIKWLFYLYYPLHLAAIHGISLLL